MYIISYNLKKKTICTIYNLQIKYKYRSDRWPDILAGIDAQDALENMRKRTSGSCQLQ